MVHNVHLAHVTKSLFPNLIQSNLVDTDKRVMLFKSKRHLLLERKMTKEIKHDISVVKLNIANLHKAVFRRTKSTETLKNCSLIYYLIKNVLCIPHRLPKQSEVDVNDSFYPVYCSAEDIDVLSTNVQFRHTVK